MPIVSSSGVSGWHDRAMVQAPGVVTGRYGTIGEVFLQCQDFWPLNTTLWVSNFHDNDPTFVYYLLQRVDFETHSGKSSVPGVNRNDIHAELVSVPPDVKEQHRIAEALSDTDRLILAVDRMIAKKQAIKQGMMQQLLTGRVRLPGFIEPWADTTWDEVTSAISSGGTPRRSRSDYWDGDIPWVTSTELKRGLVKNIPQTITEAGLEAANLDVWPAGTFLMAITGLEAAGTRGSCGILGVDAATNQSCMAVVPNHKLLTSFLFHYYVLYGEELAFRFTQGTKQQSYTAGIVKSLPIRLPSDLAEQRAISIALDDITSEIQKLLERLDKAKAIKQGMMQQLLTGRTRLPVQANAA